MSKCEITKNGVLTINGKKTIALGSHYYPSFHPLKVPVQSDQITVAKDDIKAIKDLGFNIIRTAVIGDSNYQDGLIIKDYSFVDELVKIYQENDLAILLRINGYSSNYKGVKDALMVDNHGNEIPLRWDHFIRNCLFNKDVLEDDINYTSNVAKHYKSTDGVVGYQIYNEPSYPFIGFYDYNKHTIKAFKDKYHYDGDIPTSRPVDKAMQEVWVKYRKFNNDMMNNYLIQIGKTANEVSQKPVYTCLMPSCVQQGLALRGGDFFKIAREMSFLGITIYLPCLEPHYLEYSRVLDIAYSASFMANTSSWAIECDCHVDLESSDYQRLMMSLLGAGFKGIMPYQYRADGDFEGSPEPNKYGIVDCKLGKTKKYQMVQKINNLINELSESLAKSEALHGKIAIYFSQNAYINQDVRTNYEEENAWKCKEAVSFNSVAIYSHLKAHGFNPYFVDYEALKNNLNKIDTLILSDFSDLACEEQDYLKAISQEINVYEYNPLLDGIETLNRDLSYSFNQLALNCQHNQIYKTSDQSVDCKVLYNEDEYFIFIINKDNRVIDEVSIKLNLEFNEDYQIYSIDETVDVSLNKNTFTIKKLNKTAIIKVTRGL